METKTCKQCQEEKPLGLFYNDRSQGDGKMRWCKECHKRNASKYREKRKEREKRVAEEAARAPLACRGQSIVHAVCPDCRRKLEITVD